MTDLWWNVALVLLFVLIGGVFAATEIALVSLRESQISQIAERSNRGKKVATLASDPNRFLSAVQIGVTLAGFFSAAYGASSIAPSLEPWLVDLGLTERAAATTAFILVTLVIAYLSLVLGELVPKRLALQRSAELSMIIGPGLDKFATLMRPVIWLLSKSTNAIVRLTGADPSAKGEEMTDEEVRGLLMRHEGFDEDERNIIADVLDAAGRTLAEVMTPRPDVAYVDGDSTVEEIAQSLADQPFSRFPVTGQSQDDIVGFVHVRDVFHEARTAPSTTIGDILRPILFLPATKEAISAMSVMRKEGAHIAVVVDEYGGTDGIVTLEDLVEELIGEIWDEYDTSEELVEPSADGSVDVDGRWIIEEFAERTGVELPEGPYETVAGYVIHQLDRLAHTGDRVTVPGGELTVVEVSGRRIERLSLRVVSDEPMTDAIS